MITRAILLKKKKKVLPVTRAGLGETFFSSVRQRRGSNNILISFIFRSRVSRKKFKRFSPRLDKKESKIELIREGKTVLFFVKEHISVSQRNKRRGEKKKVTSSSSTPTQHYVPMSHAFFSRTSRRLFRHSITFRITWAAYLETDYCSTNIIQR